MKTLLTITAAIVLTASLAFAGDIEVSQAKLQAIQAEWTYLNNLVSDIQQRQQLLSYQAKDLQAEIQKLVAAKKAAAVEALEQGKPKEAGK